MSPSRYFDRFELRTVERMLLREGVPVPLGARALDLLIALTDQPGELLSKDQLLDRAWPGLVVEEANVAVQVATLRKVLGAGAIATVAGLGYRFAAAVSGQRQPSAAPNNLPGEPTLFIGRAALLADAARLLATSRCLTLIGIGGSGKSRLALALAERQLGAFAAGVCFVDLAPIDDAAHLVATVAQRLGVAERPGADARETIAGHLRERALLVWLDNCEHVLEAVRALLAVLLPAAPALRVLATSREGLGVAGEQLLPVPPLATPERGAGAHEVAACESVQLFIDRARLGAPDFAVASEAQWQDIAELCRRLDGMPLAIELAAARIRLLAPAQVLAALEDRFRLLPRQQTLHAAIQWSYEHLGALEQQLLRALAVCPGGCELSTAAALLDTDPMAVLEPLERLADKSLLLVVRGSGPARYRLLETVRQFALERLDECGQAQALRERHREHFARAVTANSAQQTGHGQARWAEWIDRELDNLMSALAATGGDAVQDPGLRIANALRNYWRTRMQPERGLAATDAALARAGPLASPRLRCDALLSSAFQLWLLGRTDASAERAGEALALATAAGLDDRIGAALAHRALLAQGVDNAAAESLSAQALEKARAAGDIDTEVLALGLLAHARLNLHGPLAAEPLYEQTLALQRRRGHEFGVAASLLNLARLKLQQASQPPQDRAAAPARQDEPGALVAAARRHLSEGFALAERIGSRYLSQHLLDDCARLAAASGEALRAVRWFAATRAQREQVSFPNGELEEPFERARSEATLAAGEPSTAAAEAEGRHLGHEEAMAEVRQWLAAARSAELN